MKSVYVRTLCLPLLVYALEMAAVSDRLTAGSELDRYGAEYVGLVADLGTLSPESVDFQITDPRARARIHATSLRAIGARSSVLAEHMRNTYGRSAIPHVRAQHLAAQLDAIAWRTAQLSGQRLSFDAELARLFALSRGQIERQRARDSARTLTLLERQLPGPGSLVERLAAYQRGFVVPRGHLHAVVTAAIDACRNQTLLLMPLPQGERLTIEYVAERPWSGYSVYGVDITA